MTFRDYPYRSSHMIDRASTALSAVAFIGFTIYAAWMQPNIVKSAGALLNGFDSEVAKASADIEVLRVRPDAIDARQFREPAVASRSYREPGGWIADDVPVKKTESLHPKGMQKILAGAVPGLQEPGTYLPRGDLKAGMTEQDLSKIVTTRELKGDKS